MSANSDTLALLRTALASAMSPEALAKASSFGPTTFSQSGNATTGLTDYDLEAAAKTLYPVLTPLRNRIPRVSGKGGIQANWKAVTGIDTGQVFGGVAEGRRGGVISMSTMDYSAAYRTVGQEAVVTEEAILAAGDFDDLRSRTSMAALQSTMLVEERMILGGNTSYNLGATPAPTLSTAGTGGALGATATVSVICVALTLYGKSLSTVSGGIVQAATLASADGGPAIQYNGGTGMKSANATVVTGAGTNNVISAAVTPVRGAFGYAWFWGAAGAEVLGAVTTLANVIIAAPATGTQTAASLSGADFARNGLVFDGLLAMAAAPVNNAYFYAAAPNAGLTADSTGGILEFDNALQSMWDTLRLSPDRITVSSQEALWIRKKVLTGNAAQANARFTFATVQGQIVGGAIMKGYLNPFAAGGAPMEIPIEIHPYMPPGTVLMTTENLPYPMANITNVMQIRSRKEYYQREWPQRTRQIEFGVYGDEVLQHYFPSSMALLTNLSAS